MQDRLVLWSLLAIAAGGAAIVLVLLVGSKAFDEAFLAGVAATFMGLAIGVPATYLVGRAAAAAEARARKREVLQAILQEPQENEKDLNERITAASVSGCFRR
jgi:hypothetical protein